MLLHRVPELPGVIVADGDRVLGAVSRGQFQRTISRPFGRDVIGPRAIQFLLEELSPGQPLIFDGATAVQEAVRRSLQRPAVLLYEPILVRHPGPGANVQLVGFTDLLQADARISYLRNLQMQEILATVQEGLLLVDGDFRIASEYSRSAEVILGRRDLAGMPFPDLIAALGGSEQGALARSYLETLFNPRVIETLIGDINPLGSLEVADREGRSRQHLRFAFRRSTEAKQVRRILVRVEDRTREIELAAEIEQQERLAAQRVDLLMEMMQSDPEALTDYLTRHLDEVGRLRSTSMSQAAPHAIGAIFRVLHSLKGEAGVIGLKTFADRLHRAEDALESLRARPHPGASDFTSLVPFLDSLLAIGEEARELIARLGTFARSGFTTTANQDRNDVVPTLRRSIEELSARLGKPAKLVLHGSSDDLPQSYTALLRAALIQLARNAIVHGVESESDRRRAAKPVPAIVQLAIRRHEHEGQLEIILQDDGCGLDLQRLRKRAREMFDGRTVGDDREAAQLIFEPGFSTASTITGDAGRGVGLDLVRETIEAAGGVVEVHSEPGAFCAFQIVLPLFPDSRQEGVA